MAETLEAFKSVFKRLSFQMRSCFVFALHTRFRRSKQMDHRWLDVDLLTNVLTIGKDKNGHRAPAPERS